MKKDRPDYSISLVNVFISKIEMYIDEMDEWQSGSVGTRRPAKGNPPQFHR